MEKALKGVVVTLALVGAMAGLVSHAVAETVGEQFRKVLAGLDSGCRARKVGPYLDPADPEYRRKRGVTSCDILTLEPRDWRAAKMVKLESQAYPVPEQWLSTPQGRFAHSIKLPTSVDLVAEDTNQADGEALFQKLCGRYSGDFVLRRETDVEGLLQARPFQPFPGEYRGLVFWTREKGDLGDSIQDAFVQPPTGEYDFLDSWQERRTQPLRLVRYERSSSSSSTRYINASTRDGKAVRVPYVVVEREIPNSSAKFAFTWRGIWPGQGVELGIEGYELIIYRVQRMEILAVRRDFIRHGPYLGQNDGRQTVAKSCAERKKMNVPSEFIRTVVSPRLR